MSSLAAAVYSALSWRQAPAAASSGPGPGPAPSPHQLQLPSHVSPTPLSKPRFELKTQKAKYLCQNFLQLLRKFPARVMLRAFLRFLSGMRLMKQSCQTRDRPLVFWEILCGTFLER